MEPLAEYFRCRILVGSESVLGNIYLGTHTVKTYAPLPPNSKVSYRRKNKLESWSKYTSEKAELTQPYTLSQLWRNCMCLSRRVGLMTLNGNIQQINRPRELPLLPCPVLQALQKQLSLSITEVTGLIHLWLRKLQRSFSFLSFFLL